MLRWFQSSAPKTLPRPLGPYSVGFVDYEWSPDTTDHTPNPPAYVLARIYYPSKPVTHHEAADEVEPEWRCRSHWIPSPTYYPGYGYYLKLPWFISSPVFRLVAGNTPIWAVENAPIAPADRLPTLPLVVFSHGLAGIRTTYSSICTTIASHGYIVAAIEHRDGSASMSWLPQDAIILPYEHPPEADEEARRFRLNQLEHRKQEVSATIDLLFGKGEHVNVWNGTSGMEQAVRDDLDMDPLPELRNRVQRETALMSGHSFGAATSFFSAQNEPRISAVLALDPWTLPLPDDFPEEQERSVPCAVINSSTFYIQRNLETVRRILTRMKSISPKNLAIQITVKDTGHMDQSDFSLVIPNWLQGKYRGANLADPEKVLITNCALAASFVDGCHGKVDPLDPYHRLIWEGSHTLDSLSIDYRL